MEQVDLTLSRSLKIWWSLAWRVWVLTMLVGLPAEVLLMFAVFGHFPGATQADFAKMAKVPPGLFFVAWLAMLTLMLLLQALGTRWMIRKARWSDFRLAVVPRDE